MISQIIKWLFIVFAGILLASWVISLAFEPTEINPSDGIEDTEESFRDKYANKTYALNLAEDKIRSLLKAPSTAEFANYRDAQISESGYTYTITSYVDAQNSFGAKLRKYFKVRVEFLKDQQVRTSVISFE